MNRRETAQNMYHHEDLKTDVADYGECYGRVTSTSNAPPLEAGIEKENAVVTIESSDDEAHVPGPSITRHAKTVATGTTHVGTPRLPLATMTPNERGLYECQDCHRTYASLDVLLLHATVPHTSACGLCAFKTTTRKHLRRHETKFCKKLRDRAERDARAGQTAEPKKLWETKQERKKRKGVNAALLASLHTCWRCSTIFRDMHSLDEHVRDNHRDGIQNPPPQAVDVQQQRQASGSAADVVWLE